MVWSSTSALLNVHNVLDQTRKYLSSSWKDIKFFIYKPINLALDFKIQTVISLKDQKNYRIVIINASDFTLVNSIDNLKFEKSKISIDFRDPWWVTHLEEIFLLIILSTKILLIMTIVSKKMIF
jgi:hypothetical protein